MIKKIMLLAIAAAMLAAPANASAGMFFHEHEAITGVQHQKFSGTITLINLSGIGAIHCEAHTTFAFETNSGQVVSLEVTVDTCKGTGLFEGCEVIGSELRGSPTLTPTATDIDIEDVEVVNELTNCPISQFTQTFKSTTATPNNPDAISSLTLSGSGVTDIPGIGSLPDEASGAVEAEAPGTFGLT